MILQFLFYGVDKYSCGQVLIMLAISALLVSQMFQYNHQIIIRVVLFTYVFEMVIPLEAKAEAHLELMEPRLALNLVQLFSASASRELK